MDTKDLECFEMVFEEKSIHKAAGRLFITSQGLGRIIRSLELELDTVLFERTRQGVIPTQSGELLHERAAFLIQELHHLQNDLLSIKDGRAQFRIGLANGVLRVLPLQLILDYEDTHPDRKISWRENNNESIVNDVLCGDLEYGLVIGDHKDLRLHQKKLFSIPQVLLIHPEHPFAARSQISLEELKGEPLITMNEQFRMYHDLIRACKIKGFTPHIVARTTDGGTMAQLVAQKAGAAIIPDFGEGIPAHLKKIPFSEPSTWEVYAISLPNHKSYELIREFDEYIRDHI